MWLHSSDGGYSKEDVRIRISPVPMVSGLPDYTELQHRFADVKIHDVSEKTLPSGRKQTFETPASADQPKSIRDASEKHPLTVRRTIAAAAERISLEIRSEHIIRCLTRTIHKYDDVKLVGNPVVFWNFYPLIHRLRSIWAYTYDSERTSQELQDLEKLLAFICTEKKEAVRQFLKVEESHKVSYNELWACFVPGEIVVQTGNDFTECFSIVSSMSAGGSHNVRCMFANTSRIFCLS